MDVVLVVYGDSTFVWVKNSNIYSVYKWFDSNQGVVEGRDNFVLHHAGGKVVDESSFVGGLDYCVVRD